MSDFEMGCLHIVSSTQSIKTKFSFVKLCILTAFVCHLFTMINFLVDKKNSLIRTMIVLKYFCLLGNE
jgi:hypothetical protein